MKALPHDIQAEEALLGCVMVGGLPAYNDAMHHDLTPEDFYREAHRRIWRTIRALAHQQEAIDVFTVCATLNASGQLESVGGHAYVAQLTGTQASWTSAHSYARVVADRARDRRSIEVLRETAHHLRAEPLQGQEVLEQAAARLVGLSRRAELDAGCSARDAIRAALEKFERIHESGDSATGFKTGLGGWDRLTRGLYHGRQHILGARPGMGKSALGLWLAMKAGQRAQDTPWRRVLLISTEMDRVEIATRWIQAGAGVTAEQMASGSERAWGRVVSAVTRIMAMPVRIEDASKMTPARIRSAMRAEMQRAEEAAKDHPGAEPGIDLVVVDYLQRLQPNTPKLNRAVEVGQIAQDLSAIAKDFGAPMLTLAQLNRGVESRADKRPMLSDLRDSGEIEQEAYTISFLYRGAYYGDDKAREDEAELILAKNRGGKTGTVMLGCNLAHMRWYDPDAEPEPPRRRAPQGPSPERAHRPSKGEAWVVPPKASPPPKPAPPSPPIPSEPNPNHTTLGGKIPPSPF